MRSERIAKSEPELDRQENDWWNKNADLIEQVWAHNYEIQRAIRLPYLKKAKEFLSQGNTDTVVWEVGCGSGWVCRLIADEHFRILGTDFSESQINLAENLAKKFSKDAFCKYLVTDASTEVKGYNSILIQAILHHLSVEELDRFFKLFEKQKKGMRVFMYEPVFVQAKNNNGYLIALLYKQVVKFYRFFGAVVIKIAGTPDQKLLDDVSGLFKQAEEKGWFLSPKEVPFYENELNNYLDKYFIVHNTYFVNKSELDIAQNLMYYKLHSPGAFFTRFVIPLAMFLDRIFFKLNFRAVTNGQYFFKCHELIIR